MSDEWKRLTRKGGKFWLQTNEDRNMLFIDREIKRKWALSKTQGYHTFIGRSSMPKHYI
jgi:hypothetical protein